MITLSEAQSRYDMEERMEYYIDCVVEDALYQHNQWMCSKSLSLFSLPDDVDTGKHDGRITVRWYCQGCGDECSYIEPEQDNEPY